MNELDREGIFRAKPIVWGVRASDQSQAVAVAVQFHILDELAGDEWKSWEVYTEHAAWGNFYVIKADGKVSTKIVEQLTLTLGWNGDLKSIEPSRLPEAIVQITVKRDDYRDKVRFLVAWINPDDGIPNRTGSASTEKIQQLASRHGALLRAASEVAAKGRAGGGSKGQPKRPSSSGRVDPDAPDDPDDAFEDWTRSDEDPPPPSADNEQPPF